MPTQTVPTADDQEQSGHPLNLRPTAAPGHRVSLS